VVENFGRRQPKTVKLMRKLHNVLPFPVGSRCSDVSFLEAGDSA
jgi:hypothetical protein